MEPSKKGGDGYSRCRAQRKQGPVVASIQLDAASLDTLMRLQQAGVIRLPGLVLPAVRGELVEWRYEDFLRHMVVVQGLRARTVQGRDSTARCRVRYIAALEGHEFAPVRLRPPDEASWLDHVAWRIEEENAAGTALNQYRKALLSLFAFLGEEPWSSLRKAYDERPPYWTLPRVEVVPRFWLEAPHEDVYLRETLRHVFHFGFHVGARPPSEIVALRLDDLDYVGGIVTLTEVKKGGLRREVVVPPFVLSGPTSKSLKNYVDHVRPRVDRGESDAVFLSPEGGAWYPTKLGALLGVVGREVWPGFVPYTMRRWFATEYLVANDFNVYATAQALGDTVATVERHYLDKARAREAMAGRFRVRRVFQ